MVTYKSHILRGIRLKSQQTKSMVACDCPDNLWAFFCFIFFSWFLQVLVDILFGFSLQPLLSLMLRCWNAFKPSDSFYSFIGMLKILFLYFYFCAVRNREQRGKTYHFILQSVSCFRLSVSFVDHWLLCAWFLLFFFFLNLLCKVQSKY